MRARVLEANLDVTHFCVGCVLLVYCWVLSTAEPRLDTQGACGEAEGKDQ